MSEVVCPLCDGDGYGFETDGLVVVMAPGRCHGCRGSGTVDVRRVEHLRRQREYRDRRY